MTGFVSSTGQTGTYPIYIMMLMNNVTGDETEANLSGFNREYEGLGEFIRQNAELRQD